MHGLPIAGFDDGIRRTPYRAPLSQREIRRAYDSNPTSQMRQLAWEISRLHDVLYRTHCALTAQAGGMPHSPWRSNLLRLAELLGKEPGVAELLRAQDKRRRGR